MHAKTSGGIHRDPRVKVKPSTAETALQLTGDARHALKGLKSQLSTFVPEGSDFTT